MQIRTKIWRCSCHDDTDSPKVGGIRFQIRPWFQIFKRSFQRFARIEVCPNHAMAILFGVRATRNAGFPFGAPPSPVWNILGPKLNIVVRLDVSLFSNLWFLLNISNLASICSLPPQPGYGDCNQLPRKLFYFDSTALQCLPFKVLECQGINGNRFESVADCRSRCETTGSFWLSS